MITISNKYFVYKFSDKDNTPIYVGKTINMSQRFVTHEHLTDKVAKIEYIECKSEAEMAWKEIYYINLFYNEKSENVSGVYSKGPKMEDMQLPDKWIKYNYEATTAKKGKFSNLTKKYEKYVVNLPKYDYKNLIHILEHKKLNGIGNDEYALTQKWFFIHENDGVVDKLRNHVKNYFINIIYKAIGKSSTKETMWTTYDVFVNKIKNKGYTKGYIKLYKDYNGTLTGRKYLAFIANPFLPATRSSRYEIDSDQYALMELLKFMFQSDLRDGKEVWIYLPSSRMRRLLRQWIEENSLT